MFNYIFLMAKTNYNNRILLFCILPFNIRQRVIYVALGIVAFLIAYSAGAAVHMGKQQTEDLRRHFAEQIRGIDQNGIFINNARIALGMFVPAAGIGLGVVSGFYTGMIFTAIAATSALNNVPPLVILITPFGIMEVFAYGIAISRSGIFIYQIVKKRSWREYAVPILIEIGIVILILLAGAVIEWQIITQFKGSHVLPNA
ncbi:MAG TPA: stage II sporulation protein M [Candidatus Bathyarchaeia archaeon]|nr:stage II sporulation protein M [Candidatus Bathyarchaeia archaeon]